MDVESKFLAAFYGTVCTAVALGTIAMLIGGELASILFIIVALVVGIGILAMPIASAAGRDAGERDSHAL